MFGISFEHLLIVGVILLVVGPRRLPELGNTMGKAIKNFKDSFTGIEEASYKRLNEQKPEAPKSEAPVASPGAASGATASDVSTQSQKLAESTVAPGPARDHSAPTPPPV